MALTAMDSHNHIEARDKGCNGDALFVKESIDADGYAHIKGQGSLQEFESVCGSLGAIVYRTELKIDDVRKSIVYKHDEIEFHSDNPNVSIIGWYCARQDESDGASLLIDTSDLQQHFSTEELSILESIEVKCPDLLYHDPDAGKHAYFLAPLLSWKDLTPRIYFANWLLLDSYDEAQIRALDRFNLYLRRKQENELIRVRLNEGETLLINNRRLLHSRGAIGRNSSRLIHRIWVADPEQRFRFEPAPAEREALNRK